MKHKNKHKHKQTKKVGFSLREGESEIQLRPL